MFQGASPVPLTLFYTGEVVGTIAGGVTRNPKIARLAEQMSHTLLQDWHSHGEWFNCEPDEVIDLTRLFLAQPNRKEYPQVQGIFWTRVDTAMPLNNYPPVLYDLTVEQRLGVLTKAISGSSVG